MSTKVDTLMQSIETWLKQLAAELEEGRTEGFLGFLEAMGRFHRYSARNVALILQQRPGATLVAGIKRWNELGRRVKKGERAIAILAPTLKKVEVLDEGTGEVREERRLVGFHTAYVFDVAQTEGRPLAPTGEASPEGPALYARLRAACPVPVREGLLRGGVHGQTDGREIILAADLSAGDRAAVLLHEWAHVLLHYGGVEPPVTVKELEAEATAYAVGRHLGLSMKGSRDYILHWRGTVEGLEESLERISQTAREMLGALEGAQPAQAEAA
ncbi:ArdC-like ssDNA-binding domain-containing protein [Calidithermus chliarophilus]|uniref:ArdC-like ssDNA-binding domain-containing protein n=1 Tax=Calidithermus chliarophilus TaxID=52023 RepID=UPI00056B8A09|nr:ArdC-like ssDNA-binding domain-containing protein [Calidithermus chliarophilus]